MAVRTPSPWWLSAIFLAGLLFVYLGQRPFAHLGGLSSFATILGTLVVLAAVAVRAAVVAKAQGGGRRAELLSLATELIALVGLLVYVLSTDRVVSAITFESEASQGAYLASMRTVYAILLSAALIPKIVIEVGVGLARRGRFARGDELDDEATGVELAKVRELASSGLTVALAASFLMVTCHVSTERNARVDVSYFKTSSPGEATINMVSSVTDPIEVLLFFPQVNEVKAEVRGYFDELARRASGLKVEEHDRMLSATLAREHRVTEDGTILLLHGDRRERINVSTDFDQARRRDLRTFDSKVQEAIMRVIRAPRVAYFTVGHGELNDRETRQALGPDETGLRADLLRRRLTTLNYEVQDLGLSQGLARDVPDDATVVFVLMPRAELLPEVQESLARYVRRGGALLIALDPRGEATLGALEGALGVRFVGTPLTDDREFIVRRRNTSDHRIALTNQFSSHEAITTLGRASERAGIVLMASGYLEDAPFDPPEDPPRRTYIIRSMGTTFADVNDNYVFDDELEERKRYNVAAAIERTQARLDPARRDHDGGDDEDPASSMRALVFADGDMFSDALLAQVPTLQILVDDAIKWLGGEEAFAGAAETEEDVRIEHTKSEDVAWFYATIVGAPVLVLGFGLAWVQWGGRRLPGRAS
jgi:hypothetical protein